MKASSVRGFGSVSGREPEKLPSAEPQPSPHHAMPKAAAGGCFRSLHSNAPRALFKIPACVPVLQVCTDVSSFLAKLELPDP